MVILDIPALRAHIRHTRCWQMALPKNSNYASNCRQKQFFFILQADMYTLTDLGITAHLYMVGRWNLPLAVSKIHTMVLHMVGRWTPPLSPIAISEITTMALYIVGSLQELRPKI